MDVQIDEVTVETAQLGRMRVLLTVGDLAEYLLKEWPEVTGKKHLAAQMACLHALEGKLSGGAARIAFLEAAKQDGVWTRIGDRPQSTGKLEKWHKGKARRQT